MSSATMQMFKYLWVAPFIVTFEFYKTCSDLKFPKWVYLFICNWLMPTSFDTIIVTLFHHFQCIVDHLTLKDGRHTILTMHFDEKITIFNFQIPIFSDRKFSPLAIVEYVFANQDLSFWQYYCLEHLSIQLQINSLLNVSLKNCCHDNFMIMADTL